LEGGQASVTTDLVAGTTYYVLVYQHGTSPPRPGDTAVQLKVTRNFPLLNDNCAQAEGIPGAGPFPDLPDTTSDIRSAPATGDPTGGPSCAGAVSRSIWYSFIPATSGWYEFSSCADSPTSTTVDDTVIQIVTGAGGACGGFTEVAGGCGDVGCVTGAS